VQVLASLVLSRSAKQRPVPRAVIARAGAKMLQPRGRSFQLVVVDAQGRVREDFEIEHSALGWKKFRQRLQGYGSIPFAIETSQGAAVEQLLEAGMRVYPLNPESAQAYRKRKAPSGVKDDRLDAWSFADLYYRAHRAKGHSHAGALRCLGQRWRKIIHKMWLDRSPYDPELHHRNQLQHGSWLLQFKPT
jgi:hypothetical protein